LFSLAATSGIVKLSCSGTDNLTCCSLILQGRARPSLATLYNWRYDDLGDLPYVKTAPEFLRANPGFAHDFQFINVPDYQGQGESEPVPHFYQVSTEALVHEL